MPQTEKQKVGKTGEDIACKYLEKNGYLVIERNYWKKFGEIDIVAKKGNILHFIEVKSVSRTLTLNSRVHRKNKPTGTVAHETVSHVTDSGKNQTRKRNKEGVYRPEDNLHAYKLKRLGRAIQIYLEERRVSYETEWQVDALTVLIDQEKRVGRVEMLENIVI